VIGLEPPKDLAGLNDDGREEALSRREIDDPVPRSRLSDDAPLDLERPRLDKRETDGRRVDERAFPRNRAVDRSNAQYDEHAEKLDLIHASKGII
jgi:hypothetical protein